MTDANEIVVMFPYSAADHVKAIDESPMHQAVKIWFVFLGILLVATSAANIASAGESWTSLLPELLVAAAGVSLPFLTPLVMRKKFQRVRQDGTLELLRFGQDGFAFGADAQLSPWGLLDTATEVKSAFLLTDAASRTPLYVPKHALTPNDVERLREILKAKFLSRPKKLKLLPSK